MIGFPGDGRRSASAPSGGNARVSIASKLIEDKVCGSNFQDFGAEFGTSASSDEVSAATSNSSSHAIPMRNLERNDLNDDSLLSTTKEVGKSQQATRSRGQAMQMQVQDALSFFKLDAKTKTEIDDFLLPDITAPPNLPPKSAAKTKSERSYSVPSVPLPRAHAPDRPRSQSFHVDSAMYLSREELSSLAATRANASGRKRRRSLSPLVIRGACEGTDCFFLTELILLSSVRCFTD